MLQYTAIEASRSSAVDASAQIPAAARFSLYRDCLKRLFDLVAVLATAIVSMPVILVLAMFVALDGHTPFFRQSRIGRGGRVFTLYKLRTMVPHAERRLADHLRSDPVAAREWALQQKLLKDPRITPVGRVLRKFSLDELPQLWNVLIGDMSLVGPRPMLTDQQRLYPGLEYYCLRPGLTGPWQVSERHGSEFVARARYDREYAETVSFATDLRLLLRTVRAVSRATGC